MEKHINDVKFIMVMDDKNDIPFDLLMKMFEAYIKKYNCYEKVCLLMLNKILKECEKEKIENLIDFKISRKELIQINGAKFIEDNIEILNYFFDKKTELKYTQRNSLKLYLRTLIQVLLKKCNLKFNRFQKIVYVKKTVNKETFYFVE